MQQERIQKVLAKLGHGSRREVESWLKDGKIKVNGKVASLGDKVGADDILLLNNKKISLRGLNKLEEQIEVIVLHKPVGYLCSAKDKSVNDKSARRLVFELLPKPKAGRWVQVGRLDLNTSGLLLFTNHGELANKLMHPSSNIERVYQCRVHGSATDGRLKRLTDGVNIDDKHIAKFSYIKAIETEKTQKQQDKSNHKEQQSNTWWQVGIFEGRNREVRKIFATVGLKVNRLMRIQYGMIRLPYSLSQGKYQVLNEKQVAKLMASVGL